MTAAPALRPAAPPARLAPAPARTPDRDARLTREAMRVLAANWRGVSTVPSAAQYPHQWSWDSAFVAVGLAPWSQRRAQTELASLLGGQWTDGRVPAVVFDPAVPPEAYFPSADFWRSAADRRAPRVPTTGTVQPPLHARAAWEVYRRAADEPRARAWLARLYPRLAAQHAYLRRCRTVRHLAGGAAGAGALAAIVHPWESGLDNSPAWDLPLAAVPADLGLLRTYRRRDRQAVGADQRPTDADYARYLRLALAYRDGGYDDRARLDRAEFLVLDPLFNAVYAWSEAALGDIARLLGADPGPHEDRAGEIAAALVDQLYDPAAHCLLAWDVRTGRRSPTRTVGGLVPLVVPGLPAAVVDDLCGLLASPAFSPASPGGGFPVPSTDLGSAEFDRRRYWRGPTWVNTSWLVWRGLRDQGRAQPHLLAQAGALRERTLELVAGAGMREYFDPLTGAGYGARDFSWTAALTLDLLAAPPQTR